MAVTLSELQRITSGARAVEPFTVEASKPDSGQLAVDVVSEPSATRATDQGSLARGVSDDSIRFPRTAPSAAP